MTTVFGVPTQALFGQLLIGLINGSFYALLSLGLAVIFGLLNIINFAHGAQYMMGAFVAYFLLQHAGLGYWWSLLLVPLVIALFGIVLERATLKRLYHLDHLYASPSSSRASSATRSGRPGGPIRSPLRSRAAATWASCSCRTTGHGSSPSPSACAWAPGS
jgi:hypothetical protein